MSLNIALLETSFDRIQPEALAFSDCFYRHLFANNPELLPMFADTNLEVQEKKLVASLALIVENLHNPEALTEALHGLGAYHATKGTLKEHYPLVGKALLQAFADFLQDDWTPELQAAWTEAYHLIVEIMLVGAEYPEAYLGGELTFYEWLDLYGEASPRLRALVSKTTHFQYGAS